MKIVHVTSEFAPWVRVGHLSDAVGGLCAELARLGHEVSVFLPGYRQVLADPRAAAAESVCKHTLELGDATVTAETLRLPIAKNLTLYFVRRDESFDRSFPYGPPGGEYEDSDSRFLIFCKAVADALCRLDLSVDVLHCHDWPTALLPLLLRVEERKRGVNAVARTVFTVHQPAFQGIYPERTFKLTNLPEEFCRRHNDANIICFGQKYITPYMVQKLALIFLHTAFEGGRHQRRVDKMTAEEHKN